MSASSSPHVPNRPIVLRWTHVGAVVGTLTGLIVIFGFVHGTVILPNAVEEIMPIVNDRIDALERRVESRIGAHEGRSHRATEETFVKIAERLSRIEARLEDLIERSRRSEASGTGR